MRRYQPHRIPHHNAYWPSREPLPQERRIVALAHEVSSPQVQSTSGLSSPYPFDPIRVHDHEFMGLFGSYAFTNPTPATIRTTFPLTIPNGRPVRRWPRKGVLWLVLTRLRLRSAVSSSRDPAKVYHPKGVFAVMRRSNASSVSDALWSIWLVLAL